jgi:hypothetical protein
MTEKAPTCWSCSKYVGSGHSLDGGHTLNVCDECWKKLSVYQRLHLQLLARSVQDGGIGLRDAVDRFLNAIENAEERNGPGIFPGRN